MGACFVLMRWLPLVLWMNAGQKKAQAMIWSLELSTPTPHPLGREGEPEIEMINNTTLQSLHKLGSRRVSGLVNISLAWEGGTEASGSPDLPCQTLCTSSSGSTVSFVISYGINQQTSVSWSSVNHYSKLLNLRRGSWEPPICSQVGRLYRPSRVSLLTLGIWSGRKSRGTEPLTCGFCANSR